ncbi:hypothetical protein HN51_069421, partial [Arachis hypogaea]
MQAATRCLMVIGDAYLEGPSKSLSIMMRVATSIGWTGSQKSWSCLLEQIMEIGRHGSLAFSLPIPQQVMLYSEESVVTVSFTRSALIA